MKFLSENLVFLRKKQNMSQEEMSKALGFSTRSRVANYESGNSKPGLDDLVHLSQYFKVSIDSLLNEDLSLNMSEDTSKQLTASNKKPIISNAKAFYKVEDSENSTTLRNNCYYVPIKAYGGFLNGYDKAYYLEGLQKFPVPFITGECFCFEVDGFSMADEYLPSDKVYCTVIDKVHELIKGKDYVFQTTEGILIKKFEGYTDSHIKLKSINPDPKYHLKPVPLDQVTRVYFIEEHLRKPNKS